MLIYSFADSTLKSSDGTTHDCVGRLYSNAKAIDVAEGRRNPRTLELWPQAAAAEAKVDSLHPSPCVDGADATAEAAGGRGEKRRAREGAASCDGARGAAEGGDEDATRSLLRSMAAPAKRRRHLPASFTSPFVAAAAYTGRK